MRTSAIRTRVPMAWVPMLSAVLAALAFLVSAAPVWAHSDLRSSDPADGATLAGAPAVVSFTFNEDLLAQGNAIILTELASGARLAVGPIQVEGPVARVAWPEASPAGQYRAAYRVVSADGHPISGSIAFTVQAPLGAPGQGSTPAGSASSASTGSPASEASAASAASAASPQATDTAQINPVTGDRESGSGTAAWLIGAGVLLAGLAGGAWLLRRARASR